MIRCDNNGALLVYSPPDEHKEALREVMACLNLNYVRRTKTRKRVHYNAGVTRRMNVGADQYWLRFVFYNLLVKWVRKGRASIVLPGKQSFYYDKNIPYNTELRILFGKGKITHAMARSIRRLLCGTCCDFERGGKLEMLPSGKLKKPKTSKLHLRDEETWRVHRGKEVELAEALTRFEFLIDSQPYHDRDEMPACCVHRDKDTEEKIREPAEPEMIEIVREINEPFCDDRPSLFSYKMIFGKDETKHARLFSAFCNRRSRRRKTIVDELGWAEADVSSCAWQILYMITTGAPFHDDHFGDDLYTTLGMRYFGDEEVARRHRAIIKAVLAHAIGDNRDKAIGIKSRVVTALGAIGAVPVGTWVTEKMAGGRWGRVQLNNEQELGRRWRKYCTDETLKGKVIDPEERIEIDIEKMMMAILSEPVIREYGWRKGYISTQWVETLANVMLLHFARSSGITAVTIHDCVYGPEKDIKILGKKQWEYLQMAAGLYRRILLKRDEKLRKLKSLDQERREALASECLEGLPDWSVEAYRKVIAKFFKPGPRTLRKRKPRSIEFTREEEPSL